MPGEPLPSGEENHVSITKSTRVQAAIRMARNRVRDLRVAADIKRTTDVGPLPDFVIVGTMKAGTTSLAGNLRRHPEIFMPKGEVKFFNDHWHKGIAWYREIFAEGAGKLSGEKTPDYMRLRRYMKRIHTVVPDAKIIVLLRDPVARLMSEINHKIYAKRLPATEQIDEQYIRKVILGDPMRKRRTFDRGYYLRQIQENILSFYPRERVLIRATDERARAIDREDLGEGLLDGQLMGEDRSEFTRQLLDDICDFLGVARYTGEETLKVSGVRVYKAPITREAKELVHRLYAPENERLFEFLGYDISAWREEVAVGI